MSDSNGARLQEGKTGESDAVTSAQPREGSPAKRRVSDSLSPRADAREQLVLPIFPAAEPLPCGTYAGADLALTADAWAATGYTAAVEYFAASGQEFTCDAVRGVVGDPASNQLLGAVFSHAARRGIIRAVHVQPSARRERRGGLRRVWVGTPEYIASFRANDREAVG